MPLLVVHVAYWLARTHAEVNTARLLHRGHAPTVPRTVRKTLSCIVPSSLYNSHNVSLEYIHYLATQRRGEIPVRYLVYGVVWYLIGCILPTGAIPQQEQPQERAVKAEEAPLDETIPKLKEAFMCEEVKNGGCERPTIVFSVEKKQVFCYSLFEEVTSPRIIVHRWYYRGNLTTQIRLRLQPPRWASYSSIQLREADKGPWQVEIADEMGHVYEVLRFSVTD